MFADKKSTKFGFLDFRPQFLQPFNRIGLFIIFISLSGLLQGALTNGFLPSSFSAIETRFDVSSVMTAAVPALFEFSSLLPLLPVSYIGGRTSQTRILGSGLLVQVFGTFILLIPHFATIDEPSSMDKLVNSVDEQIQGFCNEWEIKNHSSLHSWIYVFYIGVVFMGLGNSALWANSYDYLDKNLSDQDFMLYAAIFSMTAIWGPGIGYLLGWVFLRVPFDDIWRKSEKYKYLTDKQYENLQSSPSFIGAYWLGILVIALLQLIIAVPILGFPYEFPNSVNIRKKKVAVSYGTLERETGNSNLQKVEDMSLADVRRGLKYLVTNPVYVSLVMASTFSAFFMMSLAMFGPKLSQSLFSVSPKEAAFDCALLVLPTSVLAVVVGGLLPKLLNFTVKHLLAVSLIGCFITVALSFAMFARCDNADVTKVSDAYYFAGELCNVTSCKCDPYIYMPYCLDDSLSLYNPCYYGCSDRSLEHCSCYLEDINFSLQRGDCKVTDACSETTFYILLLVLAVMCFIAFLVYPLITSAIDLVMLPQYRSFGFGLALFTIRMLGTAPAPLLSGVLFDRSCEYKLHHDGQSSCVSYSHLNWSFAWVAIICCSISFFCLGGGLLYLHFLTTPEEDKEMLISHEQQKLPCVENDIVD